MHDLARIGAICALLAALPLAAARAGSDDNCEVITATHSAETKGEALIMSQALATQSVARLKKTKGWANASVSAQQVKPDPFWKSVRKVTPDVSVYGTFLTPKAYTVCFTGVVVAYVCTSGAKVCRR
jgi:hypothetical protein